MVAIKDNIFLLRFSSVFPAGLILHIFLLDWKMVSSNNSEG